MPRYRIETTVTSRRVYLIDADNAENALPKINEGPPDHSEDAHEEIEAVTEEAAQSAD